jgi:hypothetical protein
MKKKTIHMVLLVCIAQCVAYGQKLSDFQQKQKEKALNTCPYVFEGINLYCETYLNNTDGNMWRSEYVLVTRIFRGKDKIVPGILELVIRQQSGAFHKERQYYKYDQTLTRIFFCNDVTIATPGSDTIKTNNKIKVEAFDGLLVPQHGIQQGFYGETFKSKKDVYDFLGKIENIDKSALIGIPDTMKAYRAYYPQDNKLRSAYDQSLRDAYDRSLRDAKKAKGDTIKKKRELTKVPKNSIAIVKSVTSDVTLKLWFGNLAQVLEPADGKWYLEFDIMAESDVAKNDNASVFHISINLNFDNTFNLQVGDKINAVFDKDDLNGYDLDAGQPHLKAPKFVPIFGI